MLLMLLLFFLLLWRRQGCAYYAVARLAAAVTVVLRLIQHFSVTERPRRAWIGTLASTVPLGRWEMTLVVV